MSAVAPRLVATAAGLLLTAQLAAAQPATSAPGHAAPVATGQAPVATTGEAAPAGGSREIGMGALIGLLAGVVVVAVMVGGS